MKIERILSMVGIIIGLRRYQLVIENLNKLVLIMKNWLNDPWFGCITNLLKSIKKYLEIEDGMVSKNENLIANFKLFEED